MPRTLLYLAALAVPAIAAVAQPVNADTPSAPHSVPFASQANTIELAVANRSEGRSISGATVVFTSAPEWVRVSPDRFEVGDLEARAEGAAAFTFDIDKGAPVGEMAEIAFEVRAGTGHVLETISVRLRVAAPAELVLGAPYPNPSRGGAKVSFEVPAAGQVTVSVFDALGREVAVVFDDEAAPGAYEARIPAEFSAGVYVVRLIAGPKRLVRRLTVVR